MNVSKVWSKTALGAQQKVNVDAIDLEFDQGNLSFLNLENGFNRGLLLQEVEKLIEETSVVMVKNLDYLFVHSNLLVGAENSVDIRLFIISLEEPRAKA